MDLRFLGVVFSMWHCEQCVKHLKKMKLYKSGYDIHDSALKIKYLFFDLGRKFISMKKTFIRVATTILTVSLFAGALAACGSKAEEPTKTPVNNNQNTENNNQNTENNNQNTENNNQNTENNNQNTENNNQNTENNNQNQDSSTTAHICISTYKEQLAAGASIEDALNAVAEKIELMGMVEKDLEWVQGFDTTITGYSHVYSLMPMMMGFPFIMHVFETENVDTLKAMLDAHADLRWNICTQAEEKLMDVVDGKVVFVMARKVLYED